MRHPLAAVVALALAALCASMPGPASAQANNVYTVAGIYVDVTAANAASAQQAGFASAAQLGFSRLVQRVTLPAELATRGAPVADQATLDRVVLSTDVEAERRSGTRYIGRLTVRFDPSGVRALLRAQGLTVVDARSAPELVAAVAADGTSPDTAALWQQVWSEGGFVDELAPLAVAPPALQGAPNWQTAAPFAQAAASTSALYATLRVQGSTATASLVEVSAAGQRDRGAVSVQMAGADDAALRAALASLAQQVSTLLQNDWKAHAGAAGGERARISASALYSAERQWEAIKTALGAAAQTLISEIRIEAVGRDGALVSFSFVGDRSAVVAELARRGVQLQDTSLGPVLRIANAAPAPAH
ncbi:MAG: DUF2066 domain-containing protein [Proteobacteria bacterium]|nr:DUF2066 domain-containing protein [Pseudomonadota bacterium]